MRTRLLFLDRPAYTASLPHRRCCIYSLIVRDGAVPVRRETVYQGSAVRADVGN
jgi:hypothetical protein